MIEKWFEKKLTELGGYHSNGGPRLRVVSGLNATHFACGEERIKYVHSSKVEEKWLWGLREIGSGITYAKSEKQVKENSDPNFFGVRKLLRRSVEFIGAPNYIIEYYRSAEQMKDGPLNWERNRFNFWFDPVSKTHKWTDILGPFPTNGRYDLLLAVKEDDGTRWGKFRELGEDVLDEVRKAMKAHESFKKVNTDEEMIRHMVEEQEAREDKVYAEIADQAEQDFGADWRKMARDNPDALRNEIARVNALEEQKI